MPCYLAAFYMPTPVDYMPTPVDSDMHAISLSAADDGHIENINLYPGRAELTRIFNVAVEKGQNKVDIHGLPISVVDDSLRIEGHGWATICDVVLTKEDPSMVSRLSSTTVIDTLKRRRKEVIMDLHAAQQARSSLGSYLTTITAEHADMSVLRKIFEEHAQLAKEMDIRILNLEQEASEVDKLIDVEQKNPDLRNAKLLTGKISITVLAERTGDLRFSVKYLVQGANWTPIYEIQANTQSKDKSLMVIYKALITQSTYELWKNARINLETVTPSLSMNPPLIYPWKLWVREARPQQPSVYMSVMPGMPTMMPMAPPVIIQPRSRSSSRSRSRSPRRHISLPQMPHLQVAVTDNGGVMATFRVPGLVNVPSDTQQHNITIAQLDLSADFVWYAIPSTDARVFIKGTIKNSSDYRFISGKSKTYIDGSFASTGIMPAVSPQETFDFSLGIDPGIKITYHPREKKAAQSGIYSKSTNHSWTQRISIHNTKSTPMKDLKVTDRVPLSEDQRIEVRLISPALAIPLPTGTSEKTSGSILKQLKPRQTVTDRVKVSSNVTAYWDGLGDPKVDQKALGKGGLISWLVSLAPQEMVTLELQYEICYPEGLEVHGLFTNS